MNIYVCILKEIYISEHYDILDSVEFIEHCQPERAVLTELTSKMADYKNPQALKTNHMR